MSNNLYKTIKTYKLWYVKNNEWKYHWKSFASFTEVLDEMKDIDPKAAVCETWKMLLDETKNELLEDQCVDFEIDVRDDIDQNSIMKFARYENKVFFSPGKLFNYLKEQDRYATIEEAILHFNKKEW